MNKESSFKDHFSKQSAIYAKFRPQYPPEFYAFLASLTQEHEKAWDCGTGNGQATIGLSAFYNSVIATDPSEQQIMHAFPRANVEYRVEKAEDISLDANSVDLVSIANALHWFDFDIFYPIVKKILKQDGIIAGWAYGLPMITKEIDLIISHFHDHTLNDYWIAENRLVEAGYKTIPFPFSEITAPDFISQKEFDLPEMISYLNTWSATQRFIAKNDVNPTDALLKTLEPVWGDATLKRIVTWKLVLKIGRKDG